MDSEKLFAPPQAHVADINVNVTEIAPPLWNPNAAASWSLLFSPLFGALLHMKNWQAMGETEKAESARKWAYGSLAFIMVMLLMGVIMPSSPAVDLVSRVGGFSLLIAWYYAGGKRQQAAVLARYGKNYPRKGWAKPLGLAVLALVGFVVVASILVGIALRFGGS